MIRELISCIRNFPRHTVTAIKNIWRNGVMSFSSVFSVTITLIIIGCIGLMAVCIQDMTYQVENSLTIHVKMEREISQDAVDATLPLLQKLNHVKKVTYSSKAEELQKLIDSFGEDGEIFNSPEYQGDGNPLGDAFVVEADDARYLDEIAAKIEKMDYVNKVNYGGKNTMDLVNGLEMIRNFGSVFIVGLAFITLLMISNTIKLTINSRSNEIAIMRMVGASNWFIRIPFMIEGLLIGLLGSIVPVLLLGFGYYALYDLTTNGTSFALALIQLRNPDPFIYYFGLILAGLGCFVGLVGSFMSVLKFLKSVILLLINSFTLFKISFTFICSLLIN